MEPNSEQMWLLKACLLSGLRAQDAWRQWTQRIDFDKLDPASHALLPLVSRNQALEVLQDPLFAKCKGVYRQTWVANQLHWKKVLSFLSQLHKAGVDKIVILKGMAMILHYYRDFGVRVIGDIDILIGKDQLSIAEPFLRATGWKQSVILPRFDSGNQEHLSRWHALNFSHQEGMRLDLHWSMIQENCPSLDRAVLKDAQRLSIQDTRLFAPNPADLLLQTCVHGVKYSPIPLIRWIADAMTLLKHSGREIDWERFVELAREAKVSQSVYLAVQFLSDQFNAPIPQTVFGKLRAVPLSRLEILEHRAHRRGNGVRADWYRYCLNRDYRSLASQLVHLYKYLQITARLQSPLLIPFFAVYWIFKKLNLSK